MGLESIAAGSRIRKGIYKFLTSPPMVRILDLPLCRLRGGRIVSEGCTIDAGDPAVTPWVRSLIFWGFYERPERLFVNKYLPANRDVIELGGSIGVVSSTIVRRLDPGRRLVTVEANPALIDLLRRNVLQNANGQQVSVLNRAISCGPEKSEFVDLEFGTSNLSGWVSKDSRSNVTRRVSAVSLGELATEHGIEEFTLVADIEGAEAGIFRHDAGSLANCKLMIIELHAIELDGKRLAVNDLRDIITDELGFVLRDRRDDVLVFERPRAGVDSGQ
jgi:FkbM family methyltransferase